MRIWSFFALSTFLALNCLGQSNGDLLSSGTWYTAEGVALKLDSSGSMYEYYPQRWLELNFNDSAIYVDYYPDSQSQLSIKHIVGHYVVNQDSLIINFGPPLHRAYMNANFKEFKQDSLVLYSESCYRKKKPVENFESFNIRLAGCRIAIDKNGNVTINAKHEVEFAGRPLHGVYKGAIDSSQFYAFKLSLREVGFFQPVSNLKPERYGSSYTCVTTNASFSRYQQQIDDLKLDEIVRPLVFTPESWKQNGMAYYGRYGELEEPMKELIVGWKSGMPESLRIVVTGSVRHIKKVNTLNESAHIYAIRVDTSYGDPHYNAIQRFPNSESITDVRNIYGEELIVVSQDTISSESAYIGLVIIPKWIRTPTWQSEREGKPSSSVFYYDCIKTFSAEDVSVRFLQSQWDRQAQILACEICNK